MWEFALGELAVQLECSTAAARYLVRDVLDVLHRISHLTEHLKDHKHDHHSRRGLLLLVGQRRRLLNSMQKEDINRDRSIVERLGLRR